MSASISKPCHICGGDLHPLHGFSTLVQVTSDCRPWQSGGTLAVCDLCGAVQKPVTSAWLEQARAIYAEYAIYRQRGEADQSVFESVNGANTARSNRIIDWFAAIDPVPPIGTVLDIGCGNGAFLRMFSQRYPEWRLAGLELSEQNREKVEAISGVTKFYVGAVDQVKEQFDLIVLSHVLEHIPDPVRYLESLASRLKPGGVLLIEVPDLKASPFDILIADHATHFTIDVLERVVSNAGFLPIAVESGFVPKELSLLARYEPPAIARSHIESGAVAHDMLTEREVAESHVEWLHDILKKADSIEGECGIFGATIAASWLAASLGTRASFFVDEDVNCIGLRHMNRPIYGPDSAPDGVAIFVPFRSDIAQAIARRLKGMAARLVLPPS